MHKVILLAGVFALMSGCGPSAPTPLDRHKQLVAALDEASALLAGVTDEAAAQAARPQLTAVGERIRDLYKQGRLDQAGGMDPERLKYDPKFAPQLKELQEAHDRFGKEKARVSVVPGGVNLVRTISVYVSPDSSR